MIPTALPSTIAHEYVERAAKEYGFSKVELWGSSPMDPYRSSPFYRLYRLGDYWDFRPPEVGDWTGPLLTFLRQTAHDQDKDPTQILREAHGL